MIECLATTRPIVRNEMYRIINKWEDIFSAIHTVKADIMQHDWYIAT
jgi:hypothetical protein